MLKYITWRAKKINANLIEHPNTNDRVNLETAWAITFTETPYQIADGRYISFLEHAWNITQAQLDHWRTLDPAFEFTIIDETTTNTLLSELWDVTVTNFIFTDNRPVLEL
jgi:hypothetical protein